MSQYLRDSLRAIDSEPEGIDGSGNVYAFIDEILHATKKGMLIVVDGRSEWWPRSQIQIIDSIVDYDDRKMIAARPWIFTSRGVAYKCAEDLIGY